MFRRVLLGSLVAFVLLVTSVVSVSAAGLTMNGTFTTEQRTGTITFTTVKNVAQLGSQGNFVIAGKKSPGMIYYIRGTSNFGLVWYYGNSGIMAGTGMVSPNGDGTYSGTLEFTNRAGVVTESGTLTVTIN